MSHARYIVGDTRDILTTLPDASVDLVMTSPPFLALRSYLPADHPDKAKEIGSEATPGAFLDVLLDIVVELRRVLAPHGSLCVELGDTYSGSGGAGGDYGPDGMRGGQNKFTGSALKDRKNKVLREDGNRLQQGPGWPLAKSLCMVPQSFAWALAYGRNPWTGREIEPWRVRNIVRWCRPNPPVGALGDKYRPATSEMVVACTGGSRYFDLDAVREPHARDYTKENRAEHGVALAKGVNESRGDKGRGMFLGDPAGAPPLDYWVIPTHPYPGSHYATFPPDLCVRPIKAMCPERVCRVCGKPSERITGEPEYRRSDGKPILNVWEKGAERPQGARQVKTGGGDGYRISETIGWTDCGHDDWRRGVVLDPFAGSGTTLEVATGHGRDAIGIDLDPRNADLAQQRVGMFLTVETEESAA